MATTTGEGGVAPVDGSTGVRRVARVVVPLGFVVAMVIAGIMTLPWFKPGQPEFTHAYAGAPGAPSDVVPGVAAVPVPAANDILQVTITDLTTLAQALPPEAIIGDGTTFHLLEPVLVSNGGRLVITGTGSLVLDRGSYIEVGPGGVVKLSGLSIRATGPVTNRGFLADVGGLMVLRHDRLTGLGRFTTLARGITFEGAIAGSGITDSVVRDGAIGVYATASAGIIVVGNDVVDSRLDGIQVQGRSPRPLIVGNRVTGSGGDGISLSSGAVATSVVANVVDATSRYGILVSASPGPLTIQGNFVSGAYDGIVCDNSTGTVIRKNQIDAARRFGVRLTGMTTGVTIDSNRLANSAVGVYASRGPHGNLIVNNIFDGNGENVRIRTTAPGNTVIPPPGHSELRSL